MELEQEERRGRQADELLAHPLFVEAFDTITKEIEQAWKESPARDADGREKLWMMHQLLTRLRSHIQSVSLTGQLARKTLRERLGRSVSPI